MWSYGKADCSAAGEGLSKERACAEAQSMATEQGETWAAWEAHEGGETIYLEPVVKSDVVLWYSVASFVTTFPSDDGEGACDVDVQIGEAFGVWFVRTRDDAGGSDDADNTAYKTRDAAVAAAEALALECDEGNGEDAKSYLRYADETAAGEPNADGEWCVYWNTALDDAGPRERYETQEQAAAAAKIANADLRAHNPGGNLLCGFSVRLLVNGEWGES